MRGTPSSSSCVSHLVGIIPAYAGNTADKMIYRATVRDHPRVCGEHGFYGHPLEAWLGSSPRMRGTRTHRHDQRQRQGIIPAYAGNTRLRTSHGGACRDHPRVCGEHDRNVDNQWALTGSSPRMRGTPLATLIAVMAFGIIPAYAGNTVDWDVDGE